MDTLIHFMVQLLPVHMIIGTILKVSLLTSFLLIVHTLMRRRTPRHRGLLLGIGMAAIMGLTLLPPTLPTWQFDALNALGSDVVLSLPVLQVTDGPATASDTRNTALPIVLIGIWALGAVVMSVRLVIARAALRRLMRESQPVSDPSHILRFRSASASLGIGRPVSLRVSDRVAVPLATGLFRPAILLPADSLALPEHQVTSVLWHELAHVKHHDLFWLHLSQLVLCLHWFNPLVWRARQLLLTEAEMACDNVVLSSGIDPSDYAANLLSWARRSTDGVLIVNAYNHFLEKRIMSVLKNHTTGAGVARWTGVALATLVIAVALPLAGLTIKGCGQSEPSSSGYDQSLPIQDEFVSADEMPEMIELYKPDYPEAAKAAGFVGTTWIQALVGTDGKVVRAKVAKSSGNDDLDGVALDAALKNRYRPGLKAGEPVDVWVTYQVNFAITDKTDSGVVNDWSSSGTKFPEKSDSF